MQNSLAKLWSRWRVVSGEDGTGVKGGRFNAPWVVSTWDGSGEQQQGVRSWGGSLVMGRNRNHR